MRGDALTSDSVMAPLGVTWTSPGSVELRLGVRADTWALFQRAMEGARLVAEGDALLSDDEALAAVARDALARQQAGEPGDLRRTVVLYECRACQRTELETGAGPVELDEGAAAARACGARTRDLRTEGRVVRRGGRLPRSVERAVRLRDRDRCRVPGCSRRRYVDVHHIEERARGGVHSRRNCLCLCDTHHRMLHEGALVIAGDPEDAIDFRNAAGAPIVDPLAPSRNHTAAATQCGSSRGSELLAVMGKRGGWNVDMLCDATGLPAADVATALTVFELEGRLARDAAQRYRLVS